MVDPLDPDGPDYLPDDVQAVGVSK